MVLSNVLNHGIWSETAKDSRVNVWTITILCVWLGPVVVVAVLGVAYCLGSVLWQERPRRVWVSLDDARVSTPMPPVEEHWR